MELDADQRERLQHYLASLSPEHYLASLSPEHYLAFWSPKLVVTEWLIKHHNQNLLSELQVGDLVEFHRRSYQHWAVYIGDDEVVHLTGDSSTASTSCCPSKLKNAQIKRENFWQVANGNWTRNGNADDLNNCPLPKEHIRRRALSRLGPVNYNLLKHNCEHFAKLCRYGQSRSGQAYKLYVIISIVLCVLAPVVANYSLVKMSNEFKAKHVFVTSVSVAVIPLATVNKQIRLFALFTVIVDSGGIAHVFAASSATASIVATASLVIIVMVLFNYWEQANDLMLTTGAIVALGTIEAVSGEFGQRLVLTACTMLTALAALTTDKLVALIFGLCIKYLSFVIHDYSTVIEITALLVALYKTDVSGEPVLFLAAIFYVFIVSFPLRSIINIYIFSFDFYNSMIDAVKSNIVAILIYILMLLQQPSKRHRVSSTRLSFLLTLILHWFLYDPQLVSQAMDFTILEYSAQSFEPFLWVFFGFVLIATCWNTYCYRAKQIKLQKRKSSRLAKIALKAAEVAAEVAQMHQR